MDKARHFTLDFFNAIEHNLKVENSDIGEPYINIDRLENENSLSQNIIKLRSDLQSLLTSSLFEKALDDINQQSIRSSERKIVSTGVGYSNDFEGFVKLGFLTGDVVVLWDSFLPTILNPQDSYININELGKLVGNIISLKRIAEKGGLVYLPHPIIWNPATKFYFSKIQGIPNVTNEFVGILNAMCLREEGFKLHPYLMSKSNENFEVLHNQIVANDEYYQHGKIEKHNNLYDLFKHNEFSYLDKCKPSDFYDILVSDQDRLVNFKTNLDKNLMLSEDKSRDEKHRQIREVFNAMSKDIENQNNRLHKLHRNNINKAMGPVSVIGSIVANSFDLSTTASIISIFAGMFGAYQTIATFLSDLKQKPDEPYFYQIFTEIERKVNSNEKERKELERRLQALGLQYRSI